MPQNIVQIGIHKRLIINLFFDYDYNYRALNRSFEKLLGIFRYAKMVFVIILFYLGYHIILLCFYALGIYYMFGELTNTPRIHRIIEQ